MALGSIKPLTEMIDQEYFLRDKGGRCVGLTTFPPSSDTCHEIWEPQSPGTPRACPGLYMDYFTYTIIPDFKYPTPYPALQIGHDQKCTSKILKVTAITVFLGL
jgi:hypothetical protein